MSLSIRSIKTIVVVSSLAVVPGAVVHGQERASRTPIGAAADHGTVEQFASALLDLKKPVGLILLPQDVHVTPAPLDNDDATVDLSSAVQAFEVRHRAYRADKTPSGNGFVIAPRTPTWCTRVARRRNSITTSGPVFEVLYRVYRTWSHDESPDIPPGMIGDSALYPATVVIDAADGSLQDTLTAAVEQVPGLGWALRERQVMGKGPDGRIAPVPACNLALFDGASWLDTSWTLVASGQVP